MPPEKIVADEVVCDTPEEFLDSLGRRHKFWQPTPTEWVYRGIADLNFELKASAYRNGAFDKFKFDLISSDKPVDPSREGAWSEIGWRERHLLTELQRKINESGMTVPTPIPDISRRDRVIMGDIGPELVPLWALARHHGLPTSLLDWSRRPLVAAYFAAVDAAENERSGGNLGVWAIKRPMTHQSWGHLFFHEAPNSTNPNMHAQSGLFTVLHADPMVSVDEYVSKNESQILINLELDRPVMRLVSLPQEKSRKLLRLLSDEGYDGATMFPSYDGIARYLREQALHE